MLGNLFRVLVVMLKLIVFAFLYGATLQHSYTTDVEPVMLNGQ